MASARTRSMFWKGDARRRPWSPTRMPRGSTSIPGPSARRTSSCRRASARRPIPRRTATSPAEIRAQLAPGIDGFFTDFPLIGVEARDRRASGSQVTCVCVRSSSPCCRCSTGGCLSTAASDRQGAVPGRRQGGRLDHHQPVRSRTATTAEDAQAGGQGRPRAQGARRSNAAGIRTRQDAAAISGVSRGVLRLA